MFARGIGAPELLIILFIVLLLFGVGRVTKLGSELGSAIGAFRQGLKSDEDNEDGEESETDDTSTT